MDRGLDFDAQIDDNVILGKNITIGSQVVIKAGCIIGENVTIADGTYIDYHTIIKDNVFVGKNSFIGANCILGEYQESFLAERRNERDDLLIGENAVIRSGSIIYSGTTIGTDFQTGHHAVVREHAKIGSHVSVGTLSDIQGYCEIGNYVRMHSNVFVGQESKIEDFVWLFPHVVLTDDPTPPSYELKGVTLKSFSVVAARSVLLPGVTIEGDSLVAAGAVVTKDVSEGTVVGGNPAKVMGDIYKIRNHVTGEKVYPWRYTFKRDMPWEESDYETWYQGIMGELESR